jgi:hypothetical protein
MVYFTALGGFKYKKEGDKIHYDDQILLMHEETKMYLHVTEQLLKIEEKAPEYLASGQAHITPKNMDRREPPNMFVPHYEVNLSNVKTKF